MTDIPILFSAPMIKALLSGQKTMTRRLAQRELNTKKKGPIAAGLGYTPSPWQHVKVGDRLWVRECHSLLEHSSFDVPPVWYWSDGNVCPMGDYTRPRPSIHMHRAFSRLTLIVTATKVERLQDISEADSIAEGVDRAIAGVEQRNIGQVTISTFRTGFVRLWGKLHGKESWLENPMIVALSFRVIKANIDSAEALAA